MALACQVSLLWLSPRVGFAIAFVMVALETLGVASLAPAPRVPWGTLLVLVWGALSRGLEPTAVHGAVVTAALLVGGTSLGAALGARIDRAGHLVAVAVVSGIADVWSAFAGPTAHMVEEALSRPERLPLIALPWPLWGTDTIQPVLGVGDIVFVALYLAAFARHGLSLKRAWLGLAAGFGVGLALLLALERAVPLLPMLGAGAVLADKRARELDKRELFTVLSVAAVLLGILAIRLWR